MAGWKGGKTALSVTMGMVNTKGEGAQFQPSPQHVSTPKAALTLRNLLENVVKMRPSYISKNHPGKLRSGLFLIVNICCVVTAFAVIWVPEFMHYYVATPAISDTEIQKLIDSPMNELFDEINRYSLGVEKYTDAQKIAIANNILQGELDLIKHPYIKISLPFSAKDLFKGGQTFQLITNSLIIPDILIDAFSLTKNEKFFNLAIDYFILWHDYEKSSWIDHSGFLWNDHAISTRTHVISKIWRHYRENERYSKKEAKYIIESAMRSALFLAKSDHFTLRSNHGVMQNIALLHIAISFPSLKKSHEYALLAANRLNEQFSFYINDEGVILEHSAGYHEFGVELIGIYLRYMTLLNIPIDESIKEKYTKAKLFLKKLRRSDGTLPMFGNTNHVVQSPLLLTDMSEAGHFTELVPIRDSPPTAGHYIYPIAGYNIQWNHTHDFQPEPITSQAMMVWSNFATRTHKHDDELSFLLWANGQTWWTNIGYWPYGNDYFHKASSWEGSNAPHYVNESSQSQRLTNLLYAGKVLSGYFIDLERITEDGYKNRRQLIFFKPNIWIIIDNSYDKLDRITHQVWNTYKDIEIKSLDDENSFLLKSKKTIYDLQVNFIGSKYFQLHSYFGSLYPFSGWNALSKKIYKTNAFLSSNRGNSWSIAISRLVNSQKPSPQLKKFISAEEWLIAFPDHLDLHSIERKNNRIIFSSLKEKHILIPENYNYNLFNKSITKINGNFLALKKKYRIYKPLHHYRVKITKIMLGILLVQEIFFVFLRWLRKINYLNVMRLLSSTAWIVICLWLPLYFS